jgi:hypothetical protein
MVWVDKINKEKFSRPCLKIFSLERQVMKGNKINK